MPEAGLPDTYHTETQGTTSALFLDLGVVKSLYGYVKIAEMVLDLLGFICILSSVLTHSRGTWFNTVAMGGFWYSGVVLGFYVFHVPEKLSRIPWKKIEFVFCAVWTFFYLIAASLVSSLSWVSEAYAAAAFFGFTAMVVYGFDTWHSFGFFRGTITLKTTRTTTTTTTTAQSPTTY